MGPYEVDTIYPNGAVKLRIIDTIKVPLMVNGYRLKFYTKSYSKEEFTQYY